MATTANPYGSADGVMVGDYLNRSHAPNYRYAADSSADDGYMDHPAGEWAPTLTPGTGRIPDNRRMQRIPLYQYRPPANVAPEQWWNGPHGPGQEQIARHRAVETQDADGWEMTRGLTYETNKRAAPDPRRTPPPEPRLTNKMAPTTYSYTRPFNKGTSERLNGNHFSMADHRRTYDVYGMAPVYSRRNTYRADPLPWDTNIVDQAPAYQPTPGRINAVEVADSAGRSWRLS